MINKKGERSEPPFWVVCRGWVVIAGPMSWIMAHARATREFVERGCQCSVVPRGDMLRIVSTAKLKALLGRWRGRA